MNFYRKAFAIILSVVIALQINITALAATKTKSKFTGSTYTHQTRFDSYRKLDCIDVSKHNGNIDFKRVAKQGIEAVFIRIGYTGYTKDHHSLNYDTKYKDYMKDAIAAGLKVGVYWYSQALTPSEARAEASKMLSVIGDYTITLPVVMDYEFAGVKTGRLDSAWSEKKITAKKMTENANAFIQVVHDAGYKACVYASKYFFYDNLVMSSLSDNASIWLAHYTTNTDFTGDFRYWQYTAKGVVEGIDSTYTDCNFIYLAENEGLEDKLEAQAVPDQVYTGEAICPEPVVKAGGRVLTRDVDYTLSYEHNTSVGPATIRAQGINDYAYLPEGVFTFRIVPGAVEGARVLASTSDSVTIGWDGANRATRYCVQVYRAKGWVEAGVTQGNSFRVTGLNSASNYKFRVYGYRLINNVRYNGEWSQAVLCTTNPKRLSLSYTSTDSRVTLKWTPEKYSTGYKIYKYNSAEGGYRLIDTIEGGEKEKYTVKELEPNKKSTYKVRAYKITKMGATLDGPLSAYCRAYTKPTAPVLKSASSTSSKKIKLSWKRVDNVSGYQYMWSTKKDFKSDFLSGTISSRKSSKTISTSKGGRKYYVRVRAYKTRDGVKYYSKWSDTIAVNVK